MKTNLTVKGMLELNESIYRVPNDRIYSVTDMIYQNQKAIFDYIENWQRGEKSEATKELTVGLSWLCSLINRYHLDFEAEVWKRYPYKCPSCLSLPCYCERERVAAVKTGRPPVGRPRNINDWQEMIGKIYPSRDMERLNLTILQGQNELNYVVRRFKKEGKKMYFGEIIDRCAEQFVLYLRVFNALRADLNLEYQKIFNDGCYDCHKIPCECNFN